MSRIELTFALILDTTQSGTYNFDLLRWRHRTNISRFTSYMYLNGKRIQVLKSQRQLFYFLRSLGKKAPSTSKDSNVNFHYSLAGYLGQRIYQSVVKVPVLQLKRSSMRKRLTG